MPEYHTTYIIKHLPAPSNASTPTTTHTMIITVYELSFSWHFPSLNSFPLSHYEQLVVLLHTRQPEMNWLQTWQTVVEMGKVLFLHWVQVSFTEH
jgi:hypothetical protein